MLSLLPLLIVDNSVREKTRLCLQLSLFLLWRVFVADVADVAIIAVVVADAAVVAAVAVAAFGAAVCCCCCCHLGDAVFWLLMLLSSCLNCRNSMTCLLVLSHKINNHNKDS